ncbi:hypothetical protein MINS_09420 [Mycolicibacterium insubricum]|nr:hypothetical protein MINS_09420 [Mycolicibacterium insubricum]
MVVSGDGVMSDGVVEETVDAITRCGGGGGASHSSDIRTTSANSVTTTISARPPAANTAVWVWYQGPSSSSTALDIS